MISQFCKIDEPLAQVISDEARFSVARQLDGNYLVDILDGISVQGFVGLQAKIGRVGHRRS
jgi:hypothetical protein